MNIKDYGNEILKYEYEEHFKVGVQRRKTGSAEFPNKKILVRKLFVDVL